MSFLPFCLSVYGFNVVTQLWSDLPRFTKDRGYHGIASFGGQLYVTGGYCNINSETLDIGNKKYSVKTDKHDKSFRSCLEIRLRAGVFWLYGRIRQQGTKPRCCTFLPFYLEHTKQYFMKFFHLKGKEISCFRSLKCLEY